MKDKLIAEFEASNFFEKLPTKIDDYTLKKILMDDGDKFFYFTYENISTHRSLTTYFHNETKEYKISVSIGLTEFCLTNFFTNDFNHFTEIVIDKLDGTIKKISAQIDTESDIFIADKKFLTWQYGKDLPKNFVGFELFIEPKNPVKITNGSYIIINYSDFKSNLELSIFYNVYSDTFSGESQIGGVHQPIYVFDAKNLNELEKILIENLENELKKIISLNFSQ